MTVLFGMWNKEARFTALVNALSADLYRYAYWLCRNRQVAEDLVQETYARAWRSLDDLRDEKAARAWLLTTLRREHARLYEKERPQSDGLTDPDSLPQARRDFDGSADAWALRRAMAQMADEYREPLVLQVLGGYSCEDIAAMLDITPQAVMTRLFRARQQLRQVLAGDEAGTKKA